MSNCPFASMLDRKMTSWSWVKERVGDWLRKNLTVGANEVKNKLEDEFYVKLIYNKIWYGKRDALDKIHRSWDESFEWCIILRRSWRGDILIASLK
jgi:hypothetical protein